MVGPLRSTDSEGIETSTLEVNPDHWHAGWVASAQGLLRKAKNELDGRSVACPSSFYWRQALEAVAPSRTNLHVGFIAKTDDRRRFFELGRWNPGLEAKLRS